MPPLLKSLRPRQWLKNVLVFAGLAFSGHALDPSDVLRALAAFAAFCAASSAVYLVNDVLDRERDRLHPTKRHRPVASGAVAVPTALGAAAVLAATALAVSARLGDALFAVVSYLLLQVAYGVWLKHRVLLDVFTIAAGFTLRVLAGVWAIDAWLSPWLVAVTVEVALFLALCKRRAEVFAVTEKGGDLAQRPILRDYAGPATDMMIGVMAATTLATYALYTLLPADVLALGAAGRAAAQASRAGAPGMIFTLPFVTYGMLRYLWLLYHRHEGESPELVATRDPGMALTALGYAAVAGFVIYGG